MAALKDKDGVLSNYLKTDDAFDAFGSLKSGSKNIDYTMDITSPYNNLIGMEDGTTRSTFVYGLDVISMTDQTLSNQGNKNLFNPKSSVQKNYYLQDELGSPIRLVDSKGKTTERYSYDEFGAPNGLKMALGLSKSSNPFGFTGYQYDPSTGLHFAQARYYAAGVGRFISEDSYEGDITNPLSLNPYTYVENNPLRYFDPTGHRKDDPVEKVYEAWIDSNPEKRIKNFDGFLHLQMNWRLREAQSEGICITQLEVKQLDKIYVEEQKKFHDQIAMLIGIVDPGKKAKVVKSGLKSVFKRMGQSTKNTTTLWDIKTTADKTLKYKFNGDTVTAYRDPKTGLWWAKDTIGHANSTFKVFKEAKGGKELHWVADADKYGNYILDKHKSSTGTVIKIK